MKAAILQKRTLGVMILLVLGGSIAAAAAIGGDPSGAVVLAAFYVLSGVGVWLWSGRSGDVAALLRSGGDERQRSLDLRVTAISGLAMGAFVIAGTIVQLARGEDPTMFALVCMVGGVAYSVALGVLRTRGVIHGPFRQLGAFSGELAKELADPARLPGQWACAVRPRRVLPTPAFNLAPKCGGGGQMFRRGGATRFPIAGAVVVTVALILICPCAGATARPGLTSALKLNQPIVGIATSSSSTWLASSDGGVFALGNAAFHGSAGAIRLNRPIVGIAATPTGNGYWLAASDGGIFSFGDARFHGSTGALRLNQPIVGIAATPTGNGYWLAASDGGIFSFGDARFHGSTGALRLNQPIVGIAATPTGNGYWLAASDGGIFSFGDAEFYGAAGTHSIVGIAAAGAGYWLAASDGSVLGFGVARVDTTMRDRFERRSSGSPLGNRVRARRGRRQHRGFRERFEPRNGGHGSRDVPACERRARRPRTLAARVGSGVGRCRGAAGASR